MNIEQIGNYHLWLRLLLRKAGMDPVAAFATLEAVNDVPAVPVVLIVAMSSPLVCKAARMESGPVRDCGESHNETLFQASGFSACSCGGTASFTKIFSEKPVLGN